MHAGSSTAATYESWALTWPAHHLPQVVRHISPRDRVILLCERGKQISSEGLAELIASAGDDGVPLVFCIGGPFGHGLAIQARANQSICLSKLVLNHSVAYVVLLEQLYRWVRQCSRLALAGLRRQESTSPSLLASQQGLDHIERRAVSPLIHSIASYDTPVNHTVFHPPPPSEGVTQERG